MSWGLLPNTELSKDYVQNIFDIHQARDFAHGLRSIAQFLCAQNDVLGGCGICGYLSAERSRPSEPETAPRVSKNASKNPSAASKCARCRACVIREAFSSSPPASCKRLYLHVNQHATRLDPCTSEKGHASIYCYTRGGGGIGSGNRHTGPVTPKQALPGTRPSQIVKRG